MADLEPSDIQQFLKSCAKERKATRGLNEVARGLEQRRAVVAFLANDVSEDQYKKLIEALARDANVPLVKVDSAKTLGEWVGLCRYRMTKNNLISTCIQSIQSTDTLILHIKLHVYYILI